MGIAYLKSVSLLLLTGISAVSAAENRILERLEKGEVISSKTGSSFFVQALVNKEPEKVQAAFADLSKLPAVFPQIAFARPYVDKKDERQFVYLKLRGLGDGQSVLMEVKSAGGEAFLNAKELVLSGEYGRGRDTTTEVDTAKEKNQLELKTQIDEANEGDEGARFMGVANSLVLEGPLNEVMELPNVRMTIHLGYSSYMQIPADQSGQKVSKKGSPPSVVVPVAAPEKKTYLVAKVSFGNQTAKRELGDYRGFGESRLNLAERLGTSVFSALRVNLEK